MYQSNNTTSFLSVFVSHDKWSDQRPLPSDRCVVSDMMGVWTPANCSSVSCQYPTTEGPTTVTHASKVTLGQNVTNEELEVTSMAWEQTTKVILVDLEGQFLLTSLKHHQLTNIQTVSANMGTVFCV